MELVTDLSFACSEEYSLVDKNIISEGRVGICAGIPGRYVRRTEHSYALSKISFLEIEEGYREFGLFTPRFSRI